MDEDTKPAQDVGKIVDLAEILGVLPHRYPFLLIDRVIEMRGDEFAIGVKAVTFNEHFFQGHFPGNPVMPGVLQIEGMAQTAGVMCMHHRRGGDKQPEVYFMTIDKARFRRPVVPGDVIHYHMTKIRHRFNVWKYRGEAMVDGTLVAEAELSAMMTDLE